MSSKKVLLQPQQLVVWPGQQLRGQAVKAPVGTLALAKQAPVLPQPVLLPEVPPPLALLSSPGLLLLPEDDPPLLLGPAPSPSPLPPPVVVPLLQRLK